MDQITSLPHQDEQDVIYHLVNFVKTPASNDADIKKKEESIMELGRILVRNKQTQELRKIIEETRPFLASLGIAKAAKLLRNLVDLCLMTDDQDGDIKIGLVRECIQWAIDHNRTFLRQTLEARLIRLFNNLCRHTEALSLAANLIHELKKLDDKDVLMEVELEESKAFHQLRNIDKARSSVTAARVIANSMYVPPKMQAALDLQSGILNAADQTDFSTAFSYFYEAFKGYDFAEEEKLALLSLKYMVLCKIMMDVPDDVNKLLSGKLEWKYSGSDLDAVRAVAAAVKARSLADFNAAFDAYPQELQKDPVVREHFNWLSERMLEKDLNRIILAYSTVEIDDIAACVGMDRKKVEKKLAQMILDQKLSGSLNQEDGTLTIHGSSSPDDTCEIALSTIHAMDEIVDALSERARKLW